tara:strand:- start:2809 stop:2979 length:171 start_codon:yes stop_codon:yes gene_type:complete
MAIKKEKKYEVRNEKVQLLTARLEAVVNNTACVQDMTMGEVIEAIMRLFDIQHENK